MKDLLLQMADKYDVQTIKERINRVLNTTSAKIAFLGTFSAGKTSLINSILGTNLPVDINPTTKSICIIEPLEGQAGNLYFKEDGLTRQKITYAEFDEIINGDTPGIAGLQIPPSKNLPTGCMFIDTPGTDSAGTNEAELTFRYLTLIDAAVVCVNIQDGTFKKSVIDFICRHELRSISNRIVFALTHADLKTKEEITDVKKQLIMQLDALVAEGRFQANNIESKFFTINANSTENGDYVFGFLKEHILDFLPALQNERIAKDLQAISEDLKIILTNKYDCMNFDNRELAKRNDELLSRIATLNGEIQKRTKKIDEFKLSLTDKIFQTLMSFQYAITSAQTFEEREQQIQAMNQSIVELSKGEAQKYAKSFVMPVSSLEMINLDIHRQMQIIDRTKDMSVMIATAVATAWICPGASAAANTTEAAAGAGAKAIATNSAKGAASSFARVAAHSGEEVAKNGTFRKVLGVIGKILHDINPLEFAGDMIGGAVKNKSFEQLARNKASIMSDNIVFSLEEPYNQEVIAPLQTRLAEEEKSLDEIREERKKGLVDYTIQRETLLEDIKML